MPRRCTLCSVTNRTSISGWQYRLCTVLYRQKDVPIKQQVLIPIISRGTLPWLALIARNRAMSLLLKKLVFIFAGQCHTKISSTCESGLNMNFLRQSLAQTPKNKQDSVSHNLAVIYVIIELALCLCRAKDLQDKQDNNFLTLYGNGLLTCSPLCSAKTCTYTGECILK